MSRFKHLVHEVHRRSLWQVVGIYMGGSWVALQVVESVVAAAGLPDWLPGTALVLLVIGFPVVAATAFIQEGVGPKPEGRSTPGRLGPPRRRTVSDPGGERARTGLEPRAARGLRCGLLPQAVHLAQRDRRRRGGVRALGAGRGGVARVRRSPAEHPGG